MSRGVPKENNVPILEARKMKTEDKTRCSTLKKLCHNVFYYYIYVYIYIYIYIYIWGIYIYIWGYLRELKFSYR